MSRIPMGPCIALLAAFDKDNPTPQQAVAAAAADVEALLGARLADLNDGQYAALIDLYIWKGAEEMGDLPILGWIAGGNFAKPVHWLPTLGLRGAAERDVWNLGAAV